MTWTGIRTIMVLELRQRVRATRWRVMLGIWLAVLILLCGGLTIAAAATSSEPSKEFFVPLYDLVVCFVLGIGLIVAPTLSATSINGDREAHGAVLLGRDGQLCRVRPLAQTPGVQGPHPPGPAHRHWAGGVVGSRLTRGRGRSRR